MRTRLAGTALGAVVGMGVLTGGALLLPALASATVEDGTGTGGTAAEDATATERLAARVAAITDALAGLVGDGTITQDQADRVAETLAEAAPGRGGPGGHGHGGHGPGAHGLRGGLDAAAEALGLTEDELREALADGDTLAEVAEQEGVELSTLTDALVAAAQERLDEAVAEGRVTQEEADEKAAELPARVEDLVQRSGSDGRGPGRHGHGPRGGDAATGSADGATDGTTDGAAAGWRLGTGSVTVTAA